MADLPALFLPELPLEMLLRGTAMYWFLFLLFRFVIRRRVGAVGMADLLVLVIVADAAQNAMAGEYTTVGDGAILVATLIGWTVFNDWLSFRFPRLTPFFEPPPLLLVRDGVLIRRNMRAELVSEMELLAKLREKGIASVSEVARAYLETNGELSVIPRRREASSA